MKSWPNYQPDPDRFVVFRARAGNGGLGDRLVGIISTFVLALVTQRQFRIEWNSPFPLRLAWQPASSRFLWDSMDYDPAAFSELKLVDRMPAASAELLREAILREAGVTLAVEANQHFFTYLLGNPHLRDVVAAYDFPPPEILARQILQALFVPSPRLLAKLSAAKAILREKNSIGVQIRTLWNWQDAGGGLDAEDLDRFQACAQHLLDEQAANVLLVSSDDARVVNEFRGRFAHQEVLAIMNKPIHLDRSVQVGEEEYLATFLNLGLLAECRHLIVSSWSNFGRIAALLTGRRPWVTRKSQGATAYTQLPAAFSQMDLTELVSKEGLSNGGHV